MTDPKRAYGALPPEGMGWMLGCTVEDIAYVQAQAEHTGESQAEVANRLGLPLDPEGHHEFAAYLEGNHKDLLGYSKVGLEWADDKIQVLRLGFCAGRKTRA